MFVMQIQLPVDNGFRLAWKDIKSSDGKVYLYAEEEEAYSQLKSLYPDAAIGSLRVRSCNKSDYPHHMVITGEMSQYAKDCLAKWHGTPSSLEPQ